MEPLHATRVLDDPVESDRPQVKRDYEDSEGIPQ